MVSPQSALAPQSRDGSGRFQKGQSGNPGGRPKGLVRAIREQTDDGWGVGGLDLDECRRADGRLSPECPTYVEVSPSGTGIKAYFLTTEGFRTAAKKSEHFTGMAGVEIYSVTTT